MSSNFTFQKTEIWKENHRRPSAECDLAHNFCIGLPPACIRPNPFTEGRLKGAVKFNASARARESSCPMATRKISRSGLRAPVQSPEESKCIFHFPFPPSVPYCIRITALHRIMMPRTTYVQACVKVMSPVLFSPSLYFPLT